MKKIKSWEIAASKAWGKGIGRMNWINKMGLLKKDYPRLPPELKSAFLLGMQEGYERARNQIK